VASVATRRRPRGHIETLPSGSFRAVVYTGADPLTGRGHQLKETHKTRAEAEKALTRMQHQVDTRQAPKSANTLGEAIAQWLEVAELEETTEDLIRLYVAPRLGAMQVSRLDVELLERLYAALG
jgi:integrase